MHHGINCGRHTLAARVTKSMEADAGDCFLVLDNASWHLYFLWKIIFPGFPAVFKFLG